jgi:hypothetical protein
MPEEEVLSKEELLNQLKADVNTKFTVAMLETKLLEFTGATTFAKMNKPALVDLPPAFACQTSPPAAAASRRQTPPTASCCRVPPPATAHRGPSSVVDRRPSSVVVRRRPSPFPVARIVRRRPSLSVADRRRSSPATAEVLLPPSSTCANSKLLAGTLCDDVSVTFSFRSRPTRPHTATAFRRATT